MAQVTIKGSTPGNLQLFVNGVEVQSLMALSFVYGANDAGGGSVTAKIFVEEVIFSDESGQAHLVKPIVHIGTTETPSLMDSCPKCKRGDGWHYADKCKPLDGARVVVFSSFWIGPRWASYDRERDQVCFVGIDEWRWHLVHAWSEAPFEYQKREERIE